MMHFRLCLFVCVRAETLIVSSIIHPSSVVKVVKLFVVQSFTATAKQKKKGYIVITQLFPLVNVLTTNITKAEKKLLVLEIQVVVDFSSCH